MIVVYIVSMLIFISGFINKLQELGMEITICSSPRNVNFCKTVLKLEHCYSVNELSKITNHFDLIFVATVLALLAACFAKVFAAFQAFFAPPAAWLTAFSLTAST